MNKDQVKSLMESSRTEAEWNSNCDKVKAACGGYPDFWYSEIMLSGLAAASQMSWSKTDWTDGAKF